MWVWLGDPRRAARAAPPRTPWLGDEGWSALGGTRTVAAGYLLLHENALDRTHFAYVHPDTSHRGYLEGPPPLEIEVSETSVSYARTFPAAPLAAWQSAATGLPPDTRCVQHESGVFVSPALHVDHMRIEAEGRGLPDRLRARVHPGGPRRHPRALVVGARLGRGGPGRRRDPAPGARADDGGGRTAARGDPGDGRPGRSGAAGCNAAADAASVRAEQIVRRLVDEEQPPPTYLTPTPLSGTVGRGSCSASQRPTAPRSRGPCGLSSSRRSRGLRPFPRRAALPLRARRAAAALRRRAVGARPRRCTSTPSATSRSGRRCSPAPGRSSAAPRRSPASATTWSGRARARRSWSPAGATAVSPASTTSASTAARGS